MESRRLYFPSARHWTLLKSQYHDCLSLQKDFNRYGSDFFEFKILILEEDFTKRRQLEKKLIAQQLPTKCYNNLQFYGFQKKKPQLRQQVSIDKKIYTSILFLQEKLVFQRQRFFDV